MTRIHASGNHHALFFREMPQAQHLNRIVHTAINALKQMIDAIAKVLTTAAGQLGFLIPLHEETYLILVQEKCKSLPFDEIALSFQQKTLNKIDSLLLKRKFSEAFFNQHRVRFWESLDLTFEKLFQQYPAYPEGLSSFLTQHLTRMNLDEFLRKINAVNNRRKAEVIALLRIHLERRTFTKLLTHAIEGLSLKEIVCEYSSEFFIQQILPKKAVKIQFQKEYSKSCLDTVLKELDGWTFFDLQIADPVHYRAQLLCDPPNEPVSTYLKQYGWDLFSYAILHPDDSIVKEYVRIQLFSPNTFNYNFVHITFPNLVKHRLIDTQTAERIRPYCQRWKDIINYESPEYVHTQSEIDTLNATNKSNIRFEYIPHREKYSLPYRNVHGIEYNIDHYQTVYQRKAIIEFDHTQEERKSSLNEDLIILRKQDNLEKSTQLTKLQSDWQKMLASDLIAINEQTS